MITRALSPLLFVILAIGCARPAVQAPREPTPLELMQRGALFAAHGDDFSAEQYFQAARAAGYPEAEVVRKLVGVCLQSGRLEHALGHARNYLEREPDDWLMRHVVASIYFAKGESHAARYELELLVAEHPEHAESHFLLGVLLRDAYLDHTSAKRALAQYLALAPSGSHAREAEAWLRRSELALHDARETP